MKKFLGIILAALAFNSEAVVIQGQTSPGVYTNAAVDSSGNLAVNGTVTSTISFPAQGSTTSGQTGPLVQGAVTTSAPTYTTANTNPLSLTTSGLLRIDGSGVTQPISGSVTVTGSGNFTVVQPTGTNLHAVLDTTSTTAVTQATGTNLHTVLDSGTLTSLTTLTGITNALPAGTNALGSVIANPVANTLTDCSGTITSGATAQTMVATNATRKYLYIQNVSDTTMWINFTTTAVANQPSLSITAGSSFVMESTFVSTELVSVIGATTGKAFTCKQF